MKKFTKMIIDGDEVKVFCADNGNEEMLFSVDMKEYYFIHDKDLKHNVFSTEVDWLLGEDLEEGEEYEEEIEEIRENINDEFMENFCCDVPGDIYDELEKNQVQIDYPTEEFEDEEDYLSDVFQEAMKVALGLDEHWNKIKA